MNSKNKTNNENEIIQILNKLKKVEEERDKLLLQNEHLQNNWKEKVILPENTWFEKCVSFNVELIEKNESFYTYRISNDVLNYETEIDVDRNEFLKGLEGEDESLITEENIRLKLSEYFDF